MQNPLTKPLRTHLENTIKAARIVAEDAGNAALMQLSVNEAKAPDYLTSDQKVLRRKLRSHGRALGDLKHIDETQELQHLIWEVAYEHWHRMLFARFLAENNLLMWEPGAAVSLDDCRDMVDNHPDMAMGAKSHWELAGKLAARMLPQVFKLHSPVFELAFAPEHQRELERLLSQLPPEIFQASDSLGWVYQFWQAKRKDEVNASEVKIGADELPAVTQLFTEPYMVDFLLHNSLGAWWHTRHPGQACPVEMVYLRTLEGGNPSAGKFEGWPDTLTDFKLLDPSCGSGHFLVAAFLLLVPLRMADEGLSVIDAVDSVLANNLHGLEIDPRCVEIAVFALAFAAWRYPNSDGSPLGVRSDMPAPRIACCGLKVTASSTDWQKLVDDADPDVSALRAGLAQLHDTFLQAPLLGSLLTPRKTNSAGLFVAAYDSLQAMLSTALRSEDKTSGSEVKSDDEVGANDIWHSALSAQGLLEAACLLDGRYHLVATNVPYLGLSKQDPQLLRYCTEHWPTAKYDLALSFLERTKDLLIPGRGVASLVTLGEWLYLGLYTDYRQHFLSTTCPLLIVRLGWGAFSSQIRANPALIFFGASTVNQSFQFIDASSVKGMDENVSAILQGDIIELSRAVVEKNPDSRFISPRQSVGRPLFEYVEARSGLHAGDLNQFFKCFWETGQRYPDWELVQTAVNETTTFAGREQMVLWEQESGRLAALAESVRHLNHAAQNWRAGMPFWGRRGVIVGLMGKAQCAIYSGDPFDVNSSAMVPRVESELPALWAFCESGEFSRAVREIDTSLKLAPKTLLKVNFDVAHWRQIAAERYPNGLPKPYSDDITQWIFHGHPQPSNNPLQVAVTRLLGYVWPAESDEKMELSEVARTWISRCKQLAKYVDDDGIVCLQPVRGEKPAHERLLELLIAAWESVAPGSWTPSVLERLLAQVGCAGKSLEVWIREQFFEQHSKCFQHRPFIWHVWDGQKDGFGALVNYHKLDAKNLERLIHTYLGDWIRMQEAGVVSGIDGAPLRLAAAQNLKIRLQWILDGEAPYDTFVRWKPLDEQPIGWNPDLNDGVRLNIRPFMAAEVLRHNKKPKLNITWDKDRGKDVDSAPWFQVFDGDRINDHHLKLAEKKAAREAKSSK
jgi:hypothetical protein